MKPKYKKYNWYTKPRKFDKFIRWIIFNPKSLSILMVMGHLIAVILFGALFVWAMFSAGMFLIGISFLLLVLTLRNLIKYYRFQKKSGSIFTSVNVNDMVFSGKKR